MFIAAGRLVYCINCDEFDDQRADHLDCKILTHDLAASVMKNKYPFTFGV